MIRYFRFSPQECSTMEKIRYVFPFSFNTGLIVHVKFIHVYSVRAIRNICDLL